MSIVEDAEWWAANNARFWSTRRALLAHVDAEGPIALNDGRMVRKVADGMEWDADEVMAVMPSLIRHATVTFEGPTEVIERVIEQVMETEPDAQLSEVKRILDKVAANAVLRDKTSEAAKKLAPCRTEKTKLGVA